MHTLFVLILTFISLLWAQDRSHLSQSGSHPKREMAQTNELFHGAIDLFFKEKEGPGSLCQGTIVAKNRLEANSAICRTAIFTAAHCADGPFDSLELAETGEFSTPQLTICLPRIYKTEYLLSGKKNAPKKGDLATVVLDIPCDSISHLTPPPLAPFDDKGVTQILTNEVVLQKRKGRIDVGLGNPGGKHRIKADLKSDKDPFFTFFAPTPQGAAIVGGDSGGPIYDQAGRLICPMARSTYEYLRTAQKLEHPEPDGKSNLPVDPFEVSCDKKAIHRLQAHLTSLGLSNDSTKLVNASADQSNPDCKKREP